MLRPVAFRMKHTNVRRIAKLPHIRQVGKGAPLASLVLIAPSLAWFFLQPAAVAAPGPSPVRMWEEEIRLPTYEPGKPDKNPIFYSGRSYQGAKGPVYPYPLLDTLTDVRKDRPYRAVYLENRYVQFCVLPELGGRVFAGVDKTNRYDFIYRQHVIKPALIGMVGAWISGGIEWNIPHHHRASTFMPVDHRLVENADGSKTLWLGEIELRHRMKWIVGLTLYPDKSYLEATVKLFNRTPLPHSMLYFSNVAVHANPDYQIIFPPSTEFGTQHGKQEFVHWPIGRETYGGLDRRGVDLSWWKNHPAPVSIFAWNYDDDFFGGYDHGKQAGVVHVADHHTVPGKKFFEFSNSDEGRMWDKVLTDRDGPYIELMAGAYSDNQPDYSWVQPYEVKVTKQYWYPIRRLGGIKNANLYAAVNLEVTPKGEARVALNTTENRRAQVRLEAAGKTLLAEEAEISPERPFVKTIPLPGGVKAGDLKIALVAADGRELIAYRPVQASGQPMPKPVQPPRPPAEIKTNEELYLAGLRLEQFHSPALEPYPYYEEALRRDPGDSRVNVALAILFCKRGLYAEAERRLDAAIQRITGNYTSPKDGEAFYYLGVALKAQGKCEAAETAFHKAGWSQAWYGPSHYALAELACRRRDFEGAAEFVDRALSANASNTKALDLKAVLLRRLQRPGEAVAMSRRALLIDPLDYGALSETNLARFDVGRGVRGEAEKEMVPILRDPATSFLELAADYGACGLWDEAVNVLSQYILTAEDKARISPLVRYHLGYYLEQKGEIADAAQTYRLAAQTPADCCFPFQWESAEALRSAMKQNPTDARATYYLGNLLFDLQPEKAIEAWERSRALDGSFATVHRNLGLAYAQIRGDLHKAVSSLEKAVACDPRDPRLLAELDAASEAAGVDPQRRLAVLEQHHQIVAQRDDALLREIALDLLRASTTGPSACWITTSTFGKDRRGSTTFTSMPICSAGSNTSRPGGMLRRSRTMRHAWTTPTVSRPAGRDAMRPRPPRSTTSSARFMKRFTIQRRRASILSAPCASAGLDRRALLPGPGPSRARAGRSCGRVFRRSDPVGEGAAGVAGQGGLLCQVRRPAVRPGAQSKGPLPHRPRQAGKRGPPCGEGRIPKSARFGGEPPRRTDDAGLGRAKK